MWREVQISEAADLNPEALSGGTSPSYKFLYIDLSSVNKGTLDKNAVHDIVFSESPSRARRIVKEKDVIFGTVRPNLQSHAIIPKIGVLPTVCSTGFSVLRAKDGIDPEYLYYIIMSDELYAQSVREAVGSNYPAVTDKQVEKFKFHCPIEEDEQKKISTILRSIDTAIEKTEELIAKYEKIKQGMMHDLFTRGVDENGKLRPSYEDDPELYQKTEIGVIPKEWKVSSLGGISDIRRGASPRPIDDPLYFSDKGRGWIRISDVTRSYKYLTKTTQYLSDLGASLSVPVNPGDLIMSICATIGKPVLLNMKACIHDGFVFFDNIDERKINKEFLIYFLIKNEQEINKNKQIGTQGNLNTDIVKNILFPKPSIEEQKAIAKKLRSIDETIKTETNLVAKLKKQKSSLMQDLLTGKVEVAVKLKEAA